MHDCASRNLQPSKISRLPIKTKQIENVVKLDESIILMWRRENREYVYVSVPKHVTIC